MQAGRRHGIAVCGDNEAAGLDEKRRLFSIGKGVFEESDSGMIGRMVLSKVSQGRSSSSVPEGRVGASLQEAVDLGGAPFPLLVGAGEMECRAAVYLLQVDGGLDARFLQQTCHKTDLAANRVIDERCSAFVAFQCGIRAMIYQGVEDIERRGNMQGSTSIFDPVVHIRIAGEVCGTDRSI